MKAQQFWTADNVKTFRGYDVTNGEVDLSDSEYEDILDELYGTVEICGMTYNVGSTLSGIDPVAFRCGKGDYESQLQSELEEQLSNEDDDDIEFIEELDEEEEEEDEE